MTRLLHLLEVGTGDGECTLLLAKSLPAGAMLLTMEPDATVASAARRRFADAGFGDRISVIVGDPIRFLHKVRGPFDLIVTSDATLIDRLRPLLARSGLLLVRGDKKYSDEDDMTIAEWLTQAKADAERRGLPELLPLLDGLAQSTERLRKADWNDDAAKDPIYPAQDSRRDNDQ